MLGWHSFARFASLARNCLEVIDVGFSWRDPDLPSRARRGVPHVPKTPSFPPQGIGLMPCLPGNSRAPCANELVLNNDFEVGGFELADVNAADSCPTEKYDPCILELNA